MADSPRRTCPFGFGAKPADTDPAVTAKPDPEMAHAQQLEPQKCPWPFVMLHDPKGGLTDHPWKNVAVGVTAVTLVAMAVRK
mmetsp:Transcript_61100/g.108989  ORF Transcript_61100/g.108989 Transcript_61100/m.108989 type:complete len:82 (+) Transcript_61100:16-261(+)